jgi:tetratricopeptide (TPR) repeat protein
MNKVVVTRVLSSWFGAMALLAGPAAAQQRVFADGIRDLNRAMLSVSGDTASVNAAIDKIDAGLAGWGPRPAPPSVSALLEDQASDIPVLPLAAYADGFARMLRGEYDEAIGSLRRAAAIRTDERSELVAAGKLVQQGRHVEAERTLRSIVAAFPESGVARWWLGRVYENINRNADARREYEAAVSVALAGRAPLYAAIGRLSRGDGDLARAAEAFEQRLRLTPSDPVALRDLAGVHFEQDLTEQALAGLAAALAIDPRDAEAHAGIGRIRLDAGRPAEAIPSLRRALELMPALFEARYALAQALRQIGRGDEAARELDLFDRARRESTEDRRRTMAADVRNEGQRKEGQSGEGQKEEAARQDPPR